MARWPIHERRVRRAERSIQNRLGPSGMAILPGSLTEQVRKVTKG